MRGCFIAGTDTGVGKSVLAAAIVAALVARGHPVRALKPVITGLDEEPQDGGWPADDRLLAGLAGSSREEVSPFRFGPAVSPHLAAELAGTPLSGEAIARCLADAIAAAPGLVVVEGVGGLLVPLSDGYCVRDMARDAGLPLLIAARPGLGTISHTLLTLEAARTGGLTVAGVVLTPWGQEEGEPIPVSNRATIARLGRVEVAVLPRLAGPDAGQLAEAGEGLALDRWLA